MTESQKQTYQADYDDDRGGVPAEASGNMMAMANMNTQAAREIGEIQGAIVVAQRCPRDENKAYKNIMNACKRRTLAESATYLFPRGGQKVTGPSIRLAETMARYWGNLQYGVRELVRTKEETLFEAYCWDVETNTRVSRRFSQKHWRDRKKEKGGGYMLTDERDIYEAVANSGARRLRACILEVIPGDIVEDALKVCALTKQGKMDKPIGDIIREMVLVFDRMGITQAMIEDYLGHKLDATDVGELGELKEIYTSIKDGVSKKDDWFNMNPAKPEDNATGDLNEKYAKAEKVKEKSKRGRKKTAAKEAADALNAAKEYQEKPPETWNPPQGGMDFEQAPSM